MSEYYCYNCECEYLAEEGFHPCPQCGSLEITKMTVVLTDVDEEL